MLYNKITMALRPSNIVPSLSAKESHVVDGIIGSTSSQTASKPSGIDLIVLMQNPRSYPPIDSTSNINVISSNKGKSRQQPRRKKRYR